MANPSPHQFNMQPSADRNPVGIRRSRALPKPPGTANQPAMPELSEMLPHGFAPETAIVLGSGLGPMVERVQAEFSIPYEKIPALPASTVPGHAGELVGAKVAGKSWLLFRGRVHLYEGRSAAEVTAGVRLARQLGCRTLILTNAAGTLDPRHPPGTWMQLSDHLNLTGTSPLLGGPNFADMSQVYDPELIAAFQQIAAASGVPLHLGVYAGLPGPQYETPAEIRMLRSLGADAVGMSTVLEAIQAKALGMRVAAFSCLTNWAAGLHPGHLSHTEVLETGRDAAAALCGLLEAWAAQPTTATS